MSLVDIIKVPCNGIVRRIELHHGDLTDLDHQDRVDVLVVSAFPDDYCPTPTSLIGALSAKGLSVAKLAENKAYDLRHSFSCWISQPLSKQPPGLEYGRILCFEPLFRGNPSDVVGDIFRALSPFLAGEPHIRTAAMPIVAAGDQGYDIEEMLPPIIEAAAQWMGIGMPLDTLKIFAYSQRSGVHAAKVFSKLKKRLMPRPAPVPSVHSAQGYQYDVFISYCRSDAKAANTLYQYFSENKLRVFMDTQRLQPGAAWQHQIFQAIDSCYRMIALYSQAYVDSKVCQEEFNIAWARGRNENVDLIYPIYLHSAQLPTYMTTLTYRGCRKAKAAALTDACEPLLREIQSRKNC